MLLVATPVLSFGCYLAATVQRCALAIWVTLPCPLCLARWVGAGPGGEGGRVLGLALWGRYRPLVVGTQPNAVDEEQEKSSWNGRTVRQGSSILRLWPNTILNLTITVP